MTFVNETIAAADKPYYESFHFMSPFTRNVPVDPWRWCIDRERDVFLVSLGGQGGEVSEIPLIFALVYKNQVVRFETYGGGSGNIKIGYEYWWRITQIVIPKLLQSEVDAVLALIRESLDASGYGFDRSKVKSIRIDSIAAPQFV